MVEPNPLHVATKERGVVRVFASSSVGEGWHDPDAPDCTLPQDLGVTQLASEDVQAFEVKDLASMKLSQFLAQGYDIAPTEEEADALDSATGTIAVVRSSAFKETPTTLTLAPGVALVGHLAEPSLAGGMSDMGDFASAKRRAAEPPSPPPDLDAPEDDGAPVVATFVPSREAYIRSHLWLGAAAMGGATAVLYWLENDDYWVGAVAGLLAIAVRGFYLASEELGRKWELTETGVRAISDAGAVQRVVQLRDIETVRRLGSAVQIVTKSGDKLLMKYIGDPANVQQRIAGAAGVTLP